MIIEFWTREEAESIDRNKYDYPVTFNADHIVAMQLHADVNSITVDTINGRTWVFPWITRNLGSRLKWTTYVDDHCNGGQQ